MLKVKTSLIRLSGQNNALLIDRAHVANEEAKVLAAELREQCRHDGCDEHPDEQSSITVVAQWNGHSIVCKDDFCCEAHAAKYEFNIEVRPMRRFTTIKFASLQFATR